MKTINIIFFFLGLTLSIAQSQEQVTKVDNTIKGQFEQLYKKSNNYQIYKVIKKNEYQKLQKNILDSVKNIKTDALAKQAEIKKQASIIGDLQKKIEGLNGNLETSIAKEDAISLLGIPMSKTGYNSTMWGLVVGLVIALIFFIARFKSSNMVTRSTKETLAEMEEEFETHRKKSIEREQKLRRQLQDEINKQRGV